MRALFVTPRGNTHMAYTEVTTKSWGSRLVESIKSVLVGIALFVISFPLLFWNEGRAVQTAKSLEEGASAVVSVSSEKVDPAHEGKLVHMTGETKTTDKLTDPDFNVSAVAVKLDRSVEMYQWKEKVTKEEKKKLGGGTETVTTYDYVETWSDDAIDSSGFKEDGHDNPGRLPFESQSWRAKNVTLGAFKLSDKQIGMISGTNAVTFDDATLESVPKRLHANATTDRKQLYLGKDPNRPAIGDVRVSFSTTLPGPTSLVGVQTGSTFAPYQAKSGDDILLLEVGTFTAAQMFQQAQDRNTMLTWILRLVGFVFMFAGLGMVFKPISVLGDVVPFVGNLLGAGLGLFAFCISVSLSLLTISVAWIFYRPVLGVGLLLVSGGAIYGLVMLAKKRKAAAPAVSPAIAR